ncbi:hypothetical protein L1077_08930 [Pseudoalteromonas luteoviolacea]|uniref:Uncharacterized protein n=1 Tax=Pseudoalteromonas luteoviolacea H33 TaxID=1365251 RepID=A0A162A9A6_9GAMM|nr:hypothetical protein [Pseudoalteromonas luteoviolacea]KZN46143.1 hypothetical protein N476_03205 [Pseudoalteromonas luteoviolacea H33]KZN75202.1 hypothetical protein N477_20190 [Pseudoalteromonas luteoviolacea H33-S]MBQ4875782.1 hypothetical protein [Pseudoalteromonas luteoviolacea]MBQ4904817.1 hypothetical protein [Pseudoalteromonas luteoviolacea]MCF6439549.1 hypothetical protein [Pseudoalteromonas luteoviolacea]
MNIEDIQKGEWLEYQDHPVEVLIVDRRNQVVTVWDERSQRKIDLHADLLKEDPQCHCDSFLYY